jgi:leader peptidase (prepilin peptidase) / N-methyltransferase
MGTGRWGVVPEYWFETVVYDAAMASPGTVLTRQRVQRPRAVDTASGWSVGPVLVAGLVLMVWTAGTVVVVWGPLGVGIAAVLGAGAVAAGVDLRCGRLPDSVTLTAGVVGVVTTCLAAAQHGWPAAAAAASGCAAMTLPVLGVHLASPGAMGFGDVKLAVVLGIAVGLLEWRWSVFALACASGSTLMAAAMSRRRSVPFGPGLVTGAAVAVLLASFAFATGALPAWGSAWGVARWR